MKYNLSSVSKELNARANTINHFREEQQLELYHSIFCHCSATTLKIRNCFIHQLLHFTWNWTINVMATMNTQSMKKPQSIKPATEMQSHWTSNGDAL